MDELKDELAESNREEMKRFLDAIKERAKELPPNCLENTKPHVAAKALWMLSEGNSLREVNRVTQVGHETCRRLMMDHKDTYDAQQKVAAVRYAMGAQEFVDRIFEWSEMAANDSEMLKKISPDKLAMTAGILQDKALTLSGQATSVVEHRKGKSIEEAIEIIKEARARVANKNKVVDAEVIEDARVD
jgi:hypothetical protein